MENTMTTQIDNAFPHLRLLSGSDLDMALSELLINDDEDVTALMIQNVDTEQAKFGNCILIDKNGTTNYYLPEEGGSIEQAPLLECFKQITDNAEVAYNHFKAEINAKLDSIS